MGAVSRPQGRPVGRNIEEVVSESPLGARSKRHLYTSWLGSGVCLPYTREFTRAGSPIAATDTDWASGT